MAQTNKEHCRNYQQRKREQDTAADRRRTAARTRRQSKRESPASATIFPLLQTIMQEWEATVGPMKFNLDALRASDQTGISRAISSRAGAASKLVAMGVPLAEALDLAGIE